MLHPSIKVIPNASMAEASNEIFDRDFKFSSGHYISDKYGYNNFPPTPSYLTSITATYIEPMSRKEELIKQRFVCLNPDLASTSEIAELYETTVGSLQSLTDIFDIISRDPLIATGEKSTFNLRPWYESKVINSNSRLIAAHITARTIEDHQLIDSIAVPQVIFDELPLLVRNTITSKLPIFEDVIENNLISQEDSAKLEIVLKDFLSNDPILQNLGAIAASSYLPDAKKMATTLREK